MEKQADAIVLFQWTPVNNIRTSCPAKADKETSDILWKLATK